MLMMNFAQYFRHGVLLASLFLMVGVAQAQVNQGMSEERLSRIDGVMQDYIDQEKLSGNVIYIMRNGKPVYHKAFGLRDVATNDTMEQDDIFRIASQSKAITSVGVMILQERGQLLINDPVGKYLPEYRETTVAEDDGNGGYKVVPTKRAITIRDLLTHTAGISYGRGPGAQEWLDADIFGWYTADRDEPIRETVRRMASLPQAAQPGEQFVYGYNTDILGAVIEVISGEPLDRFLKDNILEPLNMNDTDFYVPEEKRDRVATVYSLKGEKISLADNPGTLDGVSHVGQGHYIDVPRKSVAGGAGFFAFAYSRYIRSDLFIPLGTSVSLQLDIEQVPMISNAVSLTDKIDRYGRPITKINWRVNDIDYNNIQQTSTNILKKWSKMQNGMPKLIPTIIDGNGSKPYDAYHPVGTCRLGIDKGAVVDTDLRVRGINNLWVLSTGVLPSAGTANPTLTMLCLGDELADRLILELN